MINRYPILACILALLLVAYLCFALPATARMAADDTFAGCRISVADSLNTRFVTQAEVSHECDDIMQWITERKHRDVDLNLLESKLRASDRIEHVNVAVLNNGTLAIDVVPMVPVARVFDQSGSYYINAEGKRISADPRYHVDVPVVVGRFTEKYPPARLLPLLSHIAANPVLDALVSTVKQEADGNILIIPTIRGHVINFGDTSLVDNKFDRLRRFASCIAQYGQRVHRLRCRRRQSAARRIVRQIELSLKLYDDLLRGFQPDAVCPRNHFRVARLNRRNKLIRSERRKHGNRRLRTYTRNAQQLCEKQLFFLRGKAVKLHRVVAYRKICEKLSFLAEL